MITENAVREEIASQGKNALIQRLKEFFKLENTTSVSGVENDAAVYCHNDECEVLASQLFVEHVNFDLSYFPLKHLGYKVIVATVSDLLAMNALPIHLRLNLAVSNRFSVDALEEFVSGAAICCKRLGIDLVGLDITSSVMGFAISVTLSGSVKKENVVTRANAKENELICVTGDLASAYTGLLILEREKKVFQVNPQEQPDLAGYDYVLERQLKPEARIETIRDLAQQGILPTSMINVKDGIASALLHICNASKTGCQIFEEKLPIDTVTFNTLKELKIVATTVALSGGEDYELLFTVKQDDYEKIKKIPEISVIGYITPQNSGCHLISNDNRQIELRAQEFYAENTNS